MPIFRYFIFVGGALLALLLAFDLVFPAAPEVQAVATAATDQPLIRIRSDRHLPERIVLDTSQPTMTAPVVKTAAVAAPQPAGQDGASQALADMSAKARVRETFAQFSPAEKTAAAGKAEGKQAQVAQGQAGQAQVAQARVSQAQTPQSQPSPRRKIARTHPAPQQGRPVMLVAQQPHFGLFDTTW